VVFGTTWEFSYLGAYKAIANGKELNSYIHQLWINN